MLKKFAACSVALCLAGCSAVPAHAETKLVSVQTPTVESRLAAISIPLGLLLGVAAVFAKLAYEASQQTDIDRRNARHTLRQKQADVRVLSELTVTATPVVRPLSPDQVRRLAIISR